MPDGARIIWMDALRGVAASMVMFGHYFWSTISSPEVTRFFDPGLFGVAAFFCLSGYVIPYSTKADAPGAMRRFFLSRVFRLYPAYWVALALGVLTYGPDPRDAFLNITMWQRYLGGEDVVSVFWTLQVELVFYAFVFASLAFGVVSRPGVVIAATYVAAALAALCGLVRLLLDIKAPLAVPFGLTLILASNVFYLQQTGKLSARSLRRFLASVAAILLVAIVSGYSEDWGHDETPERFIVSYGLAIAFFYVMKTWWRGGPGVLSGLGAVSYSLYLLHVPVLALCAMALPDAPPLAPVVAIPVALLAAALCYRFVERPMVLLGRRVTKSALETFPRAVRPEATDPLRL